MRQTLAKIKIKCPFDQCDAQTTYGDFNNHRDNCENNPDLIVSCSYCTIPYRKSDEDGHRSTCLEFVKFESLERVEQLAAKNKVLSSEVHQLKSELTDVKECLRNNRDFHSPAIKVNYSIKIDRLM